VIRKDGVARTAQAWRDAQVLAREIEWNGARIIAGRHQLQARAPDGALLDTASVKQKDFGEVTGVMLDRSGAILVRGDQTNYRVRFVAGDNKGQFEGLEELPTLYRPGCTIAKRFFGACQLAGVEVSPALGAMFTQGEDHWGRTRAFAFGLEASPSVKLLTLPDGGVPAYVTDVPGVPYALFRSTVQRRMYVFDGTAFHACPA
jgi:hypothetical protein